MAGNGRRRGDVARLAKILRERERNQGIRLAPLAFAKPVVWSDHRCLTSTGDQRAHRFEFATNHQTAHVTTSSLLMARQPAVSTAGLVPSTWQESPENPRD